MGEPRSPLADAGGNSAGDEFDQGRHQAGVVAAVTLGCPRHERITVDLETGRFGRTAAGETYRTGASWPAAVRRRFLTGQYLPSRGSHSSAPAVSRGANRLAARSPDRCRTRKSVRGRHPERSGWRFRQVQGRDGGAGPRPACRFPKSTASAMGESGAPSPPAAMSPARKSVRTHRPVLTAITRRRPPGGLHDALGDAAVMIDRLTVRADQIDAIEWDPRLGERFDTGPGECLADLDIQLGDRRRSSVWAASTWRRTSGSSACSR